MNIATISSAVCAPPNCPATPTSFFLRRSPTSFALKVKAETTALCAPSARAAAGQRGHAPMMPLICAAGQPLCRLFAAHRPRAATTSMTVRDASLKCHARWIASNAGQSTLEIKWRCSRKSFPLP